MNKVRVSKANRNKQKEATKKFKLKSKVKAKPKGKKKRKKLITFDVQTRKNRSTKWKDTPDKVTAPTKLLAVHIAAARNPNVWVRVLA